MGKQSVAAKRKTRRRVGRPRHEVPSESYHQQRSSILREAAELLQTGSYEELTLARIAEGLDLSKASMYYYFKSKHHLLYALYEEYLDEQHSRMSEVLRIGDTKARLLAMLRRQIQGILDNLEVVRLRLSHFPVIDDPIVERCISKEARHVACLTVVVETAIADGLLPDIDSFFLTELFFGLPLLIYRSHSTGDYDPKYIESQIAALFNMQ